MFGRMECAGDARRVETGAPRRHSAHQLVGEAVPDRARPQGPARQVQRYLVEHRPARGPPQVSDDLGDHLHLAETDRETTRVLQPSFLPHHHDVGDRAGEGAPVGCFPVHQGEVFGEVQFVDDERLTLVQVHRTGVHGRARRLGSHRPEQATGVPLHDDDLLTARPPDVHLAVGSVPVGPVPTGRAAPHDSSLHQSSQHRLGLPTGQGG